MSNAKFKTYAVIMIYFSFNRPDEVIPRGAQSAVHLEIPIPRTRISISPGEEKLEKAEGEKI